MASIAWYLGKHISNEMRIFTKQSENHIYLTMNVQRNLLRNTVADSAVPAPAQEQLSRVSDHALTSSAPAVTRSEGGQSIGIIRRVGSHIHRVPEVAPRPKTLSHRSGGTRQAGSEEVESRVRGS